MTLQSSQRLPELLFYTKKSYKILQSSNSSSNPTHAQSREFSTQTPILHAEDKELFEYYSPDSRNSTHRRQGDLLEMHPCVLHDIPVTPVTPETFQTFQSFMTFQPSRQFFNVPVSPGNPPHSSILRLECIFYNFYSSIGFHRKLHRVPVGQLQTLQTFIHSSKKGRCCDIGQIDRFSIIELFPLSSCQVVILIARMTFHCSTSCLMS